MVGNGIIDPRFDGNAKIPFAHGMGLISDELYQVLLHYTFTMNANGRMKFMHIYMP